MFNFFRSNNDVDPKETYDWILSIESVIREEGVDRAKFLLDKITRKVYGEKFSFRENVSSYINTISSNEESQYPGNLEIERRIRSIIRWNAIMIVLRASKKNLDLGGHISSFQSCATIYDVCFNHFFQGREEKNGGDLVYFQGHVSPGIYSRAFLEERLTEEQLDNFRQETGETSGLSSYPHPRLMPEFWQFPTVSMGLGAISAIYQAKFLKYLEYRSLKCTSTRKVYVFLGDGEMDEPESKGALTVAAREKLDNLIFIINCNLQRLDGPVFGNGKIINELEGVFRGSGWEVIKVIWGGAWDSLLKKDITGKLVKLMNETIDGDYQRLSSFGASYIRKNFFGKYKETLSLIQDMSDEEILMLNRGGHDSKKIFSALNKAHSVVGKPVVILMHTIKGYGLSDIAEGMNIAHQVKQIDVYGLRKFRDRFNLHDVVSDQDILSLSYVKLAKSSKEYAYLRNCRKVLHGFVPIRLNKFTNLLELPKLDCFNSLLYGKGRKFSTTMAFVRILNILLSDGCIKKRIVPIIADEARTFGMEGLFKKVGIYSSCGQKYTPQDREKLIYYKEDKSGQILQEGISELGAFSSWLAAATSYSTSNFLMIPFYVFYSMFGFQRIGDLCWAAGDQQARGFLIGGTSGRTTLNGEGLQHGDGHSHIYSLTIPNCVSYNPAYAYELAVIIHNGIHRMYGENSENIYYYITTLNENYCMPDIPKFSKEGICKGIYKLEEFVGNVEKVQLLGSGSILQHVREAAKVLLKDYNISSDVYSVTSFSELARNAQDCERWNMLHPTEVPKVSYIRKVMNNAPIVVSTDYMKIFAEQIGKFVPTNLFYVLGTDGFGRSDSRRKLRRYFEIDTSYIVIASLYVLVKFGSINSDILVSAINRFKIDIDKINPRLL